MLNTDDDEAEAIGEKNCGCEDDAAGCGPDFVEVTVEEADEGGEGDDEVEVREWSE